MWATEQPVSLTPFEEAVETVGGAELIETGKYRPKRQVSHHIKIALEAVKVFFL